MMHGNVLTYIFSNRGGKSGLYFSMSAKWPKIDDPLCRRSKSVKIKLLMDIPCTMRNCYQWQSNCLYCGDCVVTAF